MATQNREQVGWIDCPICKTRGTVHQCARGRARLNTYYWRCECGAIQPWAAKGQQFIIANMVPMDSPKPSPETPPDIPENLPETPAANDGEYTPESAAALPEVSPKKHHKPARGGGWLDALLQDSDA